MKKIIFLLSITIISSLNAFTSHPYLPGVPIERELRQSSYPYLSGDTFRNFCDHIIDETRIPFAPDEVKDGDTIFLNRLFIGFFFKQIHPHIKKKYILVTHNHDFSSPGNYAQYLDDDKIIAWFSRNTDMRWHPKLVTIPIGIDSKFSKYGDTGVLDELIPRVQNCEKKYLLYMNFTPGTNPDNKRFHVCSLFENAPYCHKARELTWPQYLEDAAHSKFMLSPEGYGLDCYRTWEALYMGSIPVVQTTTIDSVYADLPVLIVQKWEEISEEFLKKKYEEMRKIEYNMDKLYADYWFERINSYKRLYQS